MNRFIWIICLSLIMAACASHKYRFEGDELVLILKKPKAQKVVLHCSIDGFKPHTTEYRSGRWETTLPANKSFSYFYVVDGVPYTPDCSMMEIDDFGSKNCVFDPSM